MAAGASSFEVTAGSGTKIRTVEESSTGEQSQQIVLAFSDGGSPEQPVRVKASAPLPVYLPNGAIGDVAHDGADSGNPVKIGGKAGTSEPTSVSAADRVNSLHDVKGRQVVLPFGLLENCLSGSGNSTGTGNTEVIAAQGAGSRVYVTSIVVFNSSATDTYVTIKDGSTAKLVIPAPKGSGAIMPLPTPLRLSDNSALNFASGAGVSTMYVSAVAFKSGV